jgi:hypothetical protein
MTLPVVVMILIGIAFVIVSFIVSENLFENNKDNDKTAFPSIDENYQFSEREQQIIKRKIEDVIANHAKDIIYDTNESLSNMANEKTMALGDYAVAVCDEIEKNHKEVMFLYSMLDDKQKEIMKTVKDVDNVKSEVKSMINEAESIEHNNVVKQQEEVNPHQDVQQERNEDVNFDSLNEADEGSLDEDASNVGMDDIFAEIDRTDIDFDEVLEEDFNQNANSNDIILEMYRNGNSVVSIAKELGLGVGEVKLVIDLYQGER